jgi:hypothetical protein
MFQQAAQNQMCKKIHGFLQSILYVFYSDISEAIRIPGGGFLLQREEEQGLLSSGSEAIHSEAISNRV